jgi:hypothetical protein
VALAVEEASSNGERTLKNERVFLLLRAELQQRISSSPRVPTDVHGKGGYAIVLSALFEILVNNSGSNV